jgi:microcystin-dependent protein
MVNLCRRNHVKKTLFGAAAAIAGLALAKGAAAGIVFKGGGKEIRLEDITPIGTIVAWGKTVAPNGFLLCNGAAVSRTTYAALFAIIGTTFGAGDTTTTFNLPNLVAKFPRGNSTAGGTGGTSTHVHAGGGCTGLTDLWSCTITVACSSSGMTGVPTGALHVRGSHIHNINETPSASHLPPYQDVIWIIKF